MGNLDAFEAWLQRNCAYESGYGYLVLGIVFLIPWAISIYVSGIAIAKREVWYAWHAAGQWANMIINYTVLDQIREPDSGAACIHPFSANGFHIESVFFTYTYFVVSPFIVEHPLHAWHIVALQLWVVFSWTAAVMVGFNSIGSAFVAANIGVALAFIAHGVALASMHFYYDRVMRVAAWFGLDDSYFRPRKVAPLTKEQREAIVAHVTECLQVDSPLDDP